MILCETALLEVCRVVCLVPVPSEETTLVVCWVFVVCPVAVVLMVKTALVRLALAVWSGRLVLSWFVLPFVIDGDKAVVDETVRVSSVEGGCETVVICPVLIWLALVVCDDATVVVGSSLVL